MSSVAKRRKMYHYTRTLKCFTCPLLLKKTTMPHTSPSSLPAYDYLVELLSQTDDSDFIREILAALLTEKEQKEIANRIQIFALFQQALPQREIAERLGVGIATVSRGAKAYGQHDINQLLPNLSHLTQ